MTTDSGTHPHDDLAVYALDALEPDERAAIDAHLEGCAACRAELDGYQATLGRMTVPEEPPDHVWEGISRQIGTAPAPVVGLDERRPDRSRLFLAAAAAVVVVVGLGAVAIGFGGDGGSTSVSEAAEQAADDPDSTLVELTGASGDVAARVVVTDDADYVVFDDLPALDDELTYQLWRTDEGSPVSLGLLGDATQGATRLNVPEDVATFAVSREPAGGSARPTDIVAS